MSSSHRPIPLIELVSMGQVGTIKKLIEAKKCDVNEADELGTRAVIVAADRDDNTEIMEILIAAGARVDVEDEFGHTPLSMATNRSHKKMAKLIEETLESYKKPRPSMK